jgi:RNA polymerase sigma-70 factor (ECF subfamily)
MLDTPETPESEKFIEAFRPRLIRASRGFLGAWAPEAEDMVQDTLWVAGPKIRPDSPPEAAYALLRQLCLRLCCARLRDRGGVLLCLEDELRRYMRSLDLEPVASGNLQLQKQQQMELLRELIKQLKLEDRQVIELRNLHGMSYSQVSQTLGIPLASVMSRLARARIQIRELASGAPKKDSPGHLPLAA